LVLAELRTASDCGGAVHVTVVPHDDYRVGATWEVASCNPGLRSLAHHLDRHSLGEFSSPQLGHLSGLHLCRRLPWLRRPRNSLRHSHRRGCALLLEARDRDCRLRRRHACVLRQYDLGVDPQSAGGRQSLGTRRDDSRMDLAVAASVSPVQHAAAGRRPEARRGDS
jgi:hypothetical protein